MSFMKPVPFQMVRISKMWSLCCYHDNCQFSPYYTYVVDVLCKLETDACTKLLTTNKCKQQKQIVNRHTEFSQFFSVLSVREIQEQMDIVDDLYECNLKVVRWVEMVILGDPFIYKILKLIERSSIHLTAVTVKYDHGFLWLNWLHNTLFVLQLYWWQHILRIPWILDQTL